MMKIDRGYLEAEANAPEHKYDRARRNCADHVSQVPDAV
jgi:hypothetical protein